MKRAVNQYAFPKEFTDLSSCDEALLGPEAKDTDDQEKAQDIEQS